MKYPYTFINSTARWYLTHPWDFVDAVYSEMRAFIQRGYRGYSDSDTWALYYYISRILSGSLKQMADNAHGYPDSMTFEKWVRELRKNAKRFEDVVWYEDEGWEKDNLKRTLWHKIDKERQKGFEFLNEWFNSLWD